MMSIRCATVSLLALSVLVAPAWAENEGLPDLDKATELQGKAESLQDLEEVIKLGEAALKKGLDKDNTDFAKQLVVSALWQHASQLSSAIFEQRPPTRRWAVYRGRIMMDLEKLIKLDASFVEAHVLVAKLQALPEGNRKRGMKAIDRAVEIYRERKDDKELATVLLLRAGLHTEAGELEKALEDFQALLAQNPQNIPIRQAVTETYVELKQFDKATESANKVVELAPENPGSYALRATVHEQQDKYDESLADWNKALELKPGNPGALLGRGRVYFMKEDLKAAAADIDRVLERDPGNIQAVYLKSLIFAADKNFVDAIRTLQNALRSDPTNVDLRLQIASYYVGDERPRKAIRILTQVLGDAPDSWRAMRARGDALLSVGKHAEAIEDYNKAVKIQPEDDGILNNLAWVLATSPKSEVRDGKRAIELALKACEVTEYKMPHILSTLAAAYAESGDFEKAIEWSKKAVELGETELKDQVDQLKDELKHYEEGKPFRELQNVKEKPDPPANVTEA